MHIVELTSIHWMTKKTQPLAVASTSIQAVSAVAPTADDADAEQTGGARACVHTERHDFRVRETVEQVVARWRGQA